MLAQKQALRASSTMTAFTSTSDSSHALMDRLSPEEIQLAAQADYAYCLTPTDSRRKLHAMSMVELYLESKNGDIDKALKKLKATLRFRDENKIDSLRSTVPMNTNLYKTLSAKHLYVAGRDREGRSTYVFVPRRVVDHDDMLLTRQAHVWTIEKAIACSKVHTINAVVDLSGFNALRDAPPLAVARDILGILRDHYVGRVHRIYILHAPTTFQYMWALFSPFAGTKTKQKITLVTNKERVFTPLYDSDQIPSWMLSSGTWDDSFPMETFMSLPFDELLA